MIEIDAIITPSTVGEICYELMRKITDNIDLTYEAFMKLLWSDGSSS